MKWWPRRAVKNTDEIPFTAGPDDPRPGLLKVDVLTVTEFYIAQTPEILWSLMLDRKSRWWQTVASMTVSVAAWVIVANGLSIMVGAQPWSALMWLIGAAVACLIFLTMHRSINALDRYVSVAYKNARMTQAHALVTLHGLDIWARQCEHHHGGFGDDLTDAWVTEARDRARQVMGQG